jgi:hypothetical protein
MILKSSMMGCRLYKGVYKERVEEISNYDGVTKLGSGYSNINFETGESSDHS